MDSSNEHADSAPKPETQAQRIAAVSALIEAQDDDVQPGEGQGNAARAELEAEAVRGDDSGPGQLDQPEPDAPDGVQDDTPGDAPGADEQDEITVSKLADHLGLEPADVYELEVPLSNNEGAVSLGQLKDEYEQYGPAKQYQEKLVQERDGFEKQVLATRSELSAILSVIPPEMRENIISAGRQHQHQWETDQKQAVLEAIPDWADPDAMAKDRANLVQDGAEYGFSEQEITYTQDARTLRMLRDFSRMKRELQGMRAAAKAQPGKASQPGRAKSDSHNRKRLQQALSRAKSDPTIQGKAAVVSQLIRNQ